MKSGDVPVAVVVNAATWEGLCPAAACVGLSAETLATLAVEAIASSVNEAESLRLPLEFASDWIAYLPQALGGGRCRGIFRLYPRRRPP